MALLSIVSIGGGGILQVRLAKSRMNEDGDENTFDWWEAVKKAAGVNRFVIWEVSTEPPQGMRCVILGWDGWHGEELAWLQLG